RQAIDALRKALEHSVVAGPRSNVSFLAALLQAEDFRAGRFDTGLIERDLATLVPHGIDPGAAALGSAMLLAREAEPTARPREADAPPSPWDANDGFRLSGSRDGSFPIVVDGAKIDATLAHGSVGAEVTVDGVPPALDARAFEAADGVHVVRRGRQTIVRLLD